MYFVLVTYVRLEKKSQKNERKILEDHFKIAEFISPFPI